MRPHRRAQRPARPWTGDVQGQGRHGSQRAASPSSHRSLLLSLQLTLPPQLVGHPAVALLFKAPLLGLPRVMAQRECNAGLPTTRGWAAGRLHGACLTWAPPPQLQHGNT